MRPLKKLKHYLEITKALIGINPACLGPGIFLIVTAVIRQVSPEKWPPKVKKSLAWADLNH